MRRRLHHALTASAIPVILAGGPLVRASAAGGPLEEYVARDDGALAFEIVGESELLGVRSIDVRLVSQEWRGIPWRHWLSILVPPKVGDHGRAVLSVGGGSNLDAAPDASSPESAFLAMLAARIEAPVAVLRQVPNQPLLGDLEEDDLIAETFDRFLEEGDDDWPLLLPMVKSVTRAMDAVQALAADRRLEPVRGRPGSSAPALAVDGFIVSGASKRGWTAWLAGAADRRVCAIAPMIIDTLNMEPQMDRQLRSYGTFSDMIEPYTSRGVQARADTPEGRRLLGIVDPYAYLPRLTLPKLVLLGTNDPYWTADAAGLYFDDLRGPKALFYLPNAGHGLGMEVIPTLDAFLLSVLAGAPFPEVASSREGNRLEVRWQGAGTATLWRARSRTRDFRHADWIPRELEGSEQCSVPLESPDEGWEASFVSVRFPPRLGGNTPFTLSTPITIVPETFPFPEGGKPDR